MVHRIPYEYDGDYWSKPYKDIERFINRTNQACRLHMLNCRKKDTAVKRFGKLIEKHIDPYRHLKVRNGPPPGRRSQPRSGASAGRVSKERAPAPHQSQAGPSSAVTKPMSAKSQKAKANCHETGDAAQKTSAKSFGYANSMQKIAATQEKLPEEAEQPHKSGEPVKGELQANYPAFPAYLAKNAEQGSPAAVPEYTQRENDQIHQASKYLFMSALNARPLSRRE